MNITQEERRLLESLRGKTIRVVYAPAQTLGDVLVIVCEDNTAVAICGCSDDEWDCVNVQAWTGEVPQ